MDRNDANWHGYWPAAPTPYCEDGSLDEEGLRALMSHYRNAGVHGVLVNGTTGEWFSQTNEERKRVAQISIDELKGSIPVVIGCTAYTPGGVLDLANHAASAGADGLLATPPPYVHPSDREIFAFYEKVTSAVALPWMIYNWPRGAAVDISLELADRLVDLENVIAYKDSTGDELKSMQGVELLQDRARVFGRFIHKRGMAFKLGVGGDGNIDGGGLGAPFAVPFYNAIESGAYEEAEQWSLKYERLVGLLVNSDYSAKWGSPTAQLKAGMRILGQPGGYVRPPLLEIPEESFAGLASALKEAGLH